MHYRVHTWACLFTAWISMLLGCHRMKAGSKKRCKERCALQTFVWPSWSNSPACTTLARQWSTAHRIRPNTGHGPVTHTSAVELILSWGASGGATSTEVSCLRKQGSW